MIWKELLKVQNESSTISLEKFKQLRQQWREQIALVEIQKIQYWKNKGNLSQAYFKAKRNQYVVQTLVDKKMRYKFETTKNVVLIGCGMYPYSLFDLHKQYPHINSTGIEIDKNRCVIAKKLINASPAKHNIKVVNLNGIDYDYSWLGIDDLVFVSVDVEIEKEILHRVIMTSKATPFLCAPYHTAWRKAYTR
jgi:tRNA G46 methylase TrmB